MVARLWLHRQTSEALSQLGQGLRPASYDHVVRDDLGLDDLIFPLPEATGPARRHRPGVLPDPFTLGFTQPNANGRTYRHGTLTAYQAGRCRCQHCKDAIAAYRATRRTQGKDNPRAPRTTATDDDRHMSNDWFRHNVWNPALKRTDLGFRVTPHGLRHAHASWLLAGGADLQVVKERLGHGSITTTEKYLHTLPNHHDAALSALDNIRIPSPLTVTEPPAPPGTAAPAAAVAAPASTPTQDHLDPGAQPRQGDEAESLAAAVASPTYAPDPTTLFQSLDPNVVRQVLAGLLEQVQAASAVTAGEAVN